MALSRCLFVIVAASIVAVGLPTRAEVAPKPPPHRMSCCLRMAGEPGHCGGAEPVKSEASQCCGACNLCLSLITASTYPFVFPTNRGVKFLDENAILSSRSDRPPIPPPRV